MGTWLTPRWRPLLLATLAIVVGAVFATWRAGTATAAPPAPKYTATTISDAVLFNDGPAAKHLERLQRGSPKWTQQLRFIQREINKEIAGDKNWATGFAGRMQSGDPRLVEEALSELGSRARKILDAMYGAQQVDRAMRDIDREWSDERLVKDAMLHNEFASHYDGGSEVWLVMDIAVAVEVVAVVAIAIVIAVIDNTPLEFSERSQLAHEILVAGIASELRAVN